MQLRAGGGVGWRWELVSERARSSLMVGSRMMNQRARRAIRETECQSIDVNAANAETRRSTHSLLTVRELVTTRFDGRWQHNGI